MLQAGIVGDDTSLSNLTSVISSNEAASISSSSNINQAEMATNSSHHHMYQQQQHLQQSSNSTFASPSNNQIQPPPNKKKRNLPGNPDPEAEVVALSPRALMATNRFVCEICNKGFQRDQNLQLHRRGHNLPWKLKQRSKTEIVKKKVYICPEASCVHHDPSRALGDLTGIKKHFSRKHGEKKWKCEKCSKRYAVQSDWKAHSKICGTREYRCDCGTLFSRRDSFITHRAFCDALAEESSRSITPQILSSSQTSPNNFNSTNNPLIIPSSSLKQEINPQNYTHLPPWLSSQHSSAGPNFMTPSPRVEQSFHHQENPNPNNVVPNNLSSSVSLMSATALLQKAASMGVTMSAKNMSSSDHLSILNMRTHQHQHQNQNQHHVGAPGFCATSSLISREADNLGSSVGTKTAAPFMHGFANMEQNIVQNQINFSNMVSSSLPPSSTSGFDAAGAAASLANFEGFQQNNAHLMAGLRKDGGGGTRGDGLTRDFLGLRGPFPDHRDFINLAGFEQMGNSSYDHHHHHHHGQAQNQEPWQS